mmetsp:Transcript_8110/g.18986  ORF Transcript_8110/g.18986 Transcript_8110/m.18986 type:complete len:206 (+) Transcript_8110:5055-5672(+)
MTAPTSLLGFVSPPRIRRNGCATLAGSGRLDFTVNSIIKLGFISDDCNRIDIVSTVPIATRDWGEPVGGETEGARLRRLSGSEFINPSVKLTSVGMMICKYSVRTLRMPCMKRRIASSRSMSFAAAAVATSHSDISTDPMVARMSRTNIGTNALKSSGTAQATRSTKEHSAARCLVSQNCSTTSKISGKYGRRCSLTIALRLETF